MIILNIFRLRNFMQLLFIKQSDSRLLFMKNHGLDEVFFIDVNLHGAMINFIIGAIESLHSKEKQLALRYKVNVEEKFALMVSLVYSFIFLFTFCFRIHLIYGVLDV